MEDVQRSTLDCCPQSVCFLYSTAKSQAAHRHRDTITWSEPHIAGAGNDLAPAAEEEGLGRRGGGGCEEGRRERREREGRKHCRSELSHGTHLHRERELLQMFKRETREREAERERERERERRGRDRGRERREREEQREAERESGRERGRESRRERGDHRERGRERERQRDMGAHCDSTTQSPQEIQVGGRYRRRYRGEIQERYRGEIQEGDVSKPH